jgi:hypothetical protein
MSHAARLFKTIVVAGASLALPNCGGESSRNVSKGTGGAGGTSAGAGGAAGSGGVAIGATGGTAGLVDSETGLTPVDCADPADFVCGSYEPERECRCDPTLPQVPTDCEFTSQFHCECHDGFTYACVPEETYPAPRAVVCRCDSTAPRGPEDCQETQQFECLAYSPFEQACVCNPDAPLSDADCLAWEYFQCRHVDPYYGCDCVATIR